MIRSEAAGAGLRPGVRRPGQITMCVPGTIPDPPASLHQLCLNESPFGPLPTVSLALANSIMQTNRYPEFYPERLTELIAGRLGLAAGSVAVGSGSVGVALQLLQAVIEPGDAMVYGWRNFDAYPLLARMAGARPVEVPLRPDGRQDLDAMASDSGPGHEGDGVVQPAQPDRQPHQIPGADSLPPSDPPERHHHPRRGVHRVRPRPRRAGRVGPPGRPSEPARAPHVLQGLRTGRLACRLCARRPGPDRNSEIAAAALRHQLLCLRRRQGIPRSHRRTPAPHRHGPRRTGPFVVPAPPGRAAGPS